MKWLAISLLAATCAATACGGGQKRPTIVNKGSDTLLNVAQAWAEAYRTVAPDVAVVVSGGGSGVGIAGLLNGTVDVANASRKMKDEEIELARSKGFEPVEHIVGYDALAVYVHKDNPVESLTLGQLRAIYGEGGEVTKWSQLGITIPNGKDDIVRVSRQNNSGTYAYFREATLAEGQDYKLGSNDMAGSKDVVELVGRTPTAIGYSGLAYATDQVKLVPIKRDDNAPAVHASIATALDGTYPIARPLFMYSHGEAAGAAKAYLDWLLSPAGQKIIEDKGYAPATKQD